MVENKTFTVKDQLGADGKVIDKIYSITISEVKETVKTYSGTEIDKKINTLTEEISKLQEELNYLNGMIK